MSSTKESNPSIPNENPQGAQLEDDIHSLKSMNPREAKTCKSSFSIEEILKPTFGAKTCAEIDISQPLDMRIERNNDVNGESEKEKVYMDVSTGPCPFRSSSPDQNSTNNSSNNSSSSNSSSSNSSSSNSSSSNSRDSSPDSRNYSCSENGNGYEFKKLYQEQKSQSRAFSPYKDAMTESADVNFLTSRSYYDTLSHAYGLNLHSMGSHLFYHLGQFKQSSIPLSDNPCLSKNYFCSSVYTNGSTNLKILAANNTGQFRRSSQENTVPVTANTVQSNRGHAGGRPSLAVKASSRSRSSVALKCEHSGDGPGDRKTNVKSDKKCISEDTIGEPKSNKPDDKFVWPAWVYCTRYSDRPSSGPRYRKPRTRSNNENDKRPRTAFSTQQLHRLRHEFESCPYLSETRRQNLALDLCLNESQVKIWFQNKRAKLKKSTGSKNQLALRLMEEGLYNHSTIVVDGVGNKSESRHDGSR